VITTEPFEAIDDEAFAKARKWIESCERVILTDFPIGGTNARVAELIQLAESRGTLEKA
jgi:iron complex transport system ATP-binding protein